MNFCVLGSGAWGTAMALHLVGLGHTVTLVPRRIEAALEMASERENRDYLPGFHLPRSLQIGYELLPALMEADVAVLACPSHGLRETVGRIKACQGAAKALKLVITLCKGLEADSFKRPAEVVEELLPEVRHAVLTGPTNAAEVALGKPTAMTLGVTVVDELIERVQAALSSKTLRVYTSEDVTGVELGGCLKNIYAIAAGCADGLRIGDNGKAALLTRALNEMVRLGSSLGADPKTFFGLSGFGDLVATCHGDWSRNRTLGQQIGEGKSFESLMEGRKTVAEGALATNVFYHLCEQRGIDAPILRQVYSVLYEGLDPKEAISALMLRDLKTE